MVYHLLSQIEILTSLHFDPIVMVDNVVIGYKFTIVEILGSVDAGIEMMGIKGSCDAQAKRDACHVVEYRVFGIERRAS
jgi:hypothetical protein